MTQSHIRNVYPSAIYKQRELMYFELYIENVAVCYMARSL